MPWKRGRIVLSLSHAATLVALILSAEVGAQVRGVPRTPDGHPDLQGVWDFATLTPLDGPRSLPINRS